jgi:MFS family permease
MQRARTRPFFLLMTLPATAMGLALSVQISALSWILATRYGLAIHEIGLVWAAGPIAGIIGQVVIGIISDRLWVWNGRRRVFIVAGGILAALMILTLPAIGFISRALGLDAVIGVAVTVALALDLAINVSFNPTRAIIADVTAEGPERSRGYTWMQTVSGSVSVAAYGFGAAFGNIALIYASAGFVLLFSLIPAFLIEEPREHVSHQPGTDAIQWRELVSALSPLWAILAYDLYAIGMKLAGASWAGRTPELLCAAATAVLVGHALIAGTGKLAEFRKIIAAHALSWIGIQSLFIYLVSFLQHRMPWLDADALGRTTALAFLALNGVAAVAPMLVLGPLTRRFRRAHVHAVSVAVLACCFAALWLFARTPEMLYAVMAIAGVGWGSIVSLPFAIMSERVDASRTGLFMGLFNLAVTLPQLIASFALGAFMSAADDKGSIFAIGAACIGLSAVAWMFVRPQRRPEPRLVAAPAE